MFDAHVHLDFLKSAAVEYVRRARCAGVRGFAIPGVSAKQWASAERVAKSVGGFWGCGIHPEYASAELRSQVASPAMNAEVAALTRHAKEASPDFIGETGLDARLEGDFSKQAQERLFLAHLGLAESLHLPLVVHSVRRHARVLKLLEGSDVRGMVHGFIGSPETAARFFSRGWLLSAGRGAMRSPKTARAFASAPLDAVLLESDEPAEQSDVPPLLDWLCEIRREPTERIASRVHDNALALFSPAEAESTRS